MLFLHMTAPTTPGTMIRSSSSIISHHSDDVVLPLVEDEAEHQHSAALLLVVHLLLTHILAWGVFKGALHLPPPLEVKTFTNI